MCFLPAFGITKMDEAKPVILLIPIFILGTTSNLLQPEYSIRIVNTENFILSLGDLDEKNDDLELIRAPPDPILKKKLSQFHKYVDTLHMERQAMKQSKLSKQLKYKPMNLISEFQIFSQDLPFGTTSDRTRFKIWARKRRKRRKKNFKKNLIKRFQFRNYKFHKPAIVKRQMPTNFKKKIEDNEYDYLAKDYWDLVNKSLVNKTAFKYSEEGKPEESIKDIIGKITDIKTPKNCSKIVSLGVQAVECAIKDFQDKQISKQVMIQKISSIALIWIAIYMVFAIPLWCTKGWCCCCFRFEFCLPVSTVRKIQKYVADNPPGIFINKDGGEERYTPTKRETELYESLTRSIAEF